ncbi:MAG: hypothetical protein KTR16_08905 [Acidiferrobacterales bacterium]|nr:hypothetical protein [Acidiferrobacterales bacterium]
MADHALLIERQVIEGQVLALSSLNAAVTNLISSAMSPEQITAIVSKGVFSPTEDELMEYWFAHFTTLRNNLWSVIETCVYYTGGVSKVNRPHHYQYFVLGYSAMCSLIRMDRFLISKIAYDTVIQRKLNEPLPRHRIERKQFNEIYKSLLNPANAIRIYQARRLLKNRLNDIQAAVSGTPVEDIFNTLEKQERYLELSWRKFFFTWMRSRKLVWRRRGASAKQKSLFAMLEYGGRIASELILPRTKKVTPEIVSQLEALLRPGDIFITRHSRAMTNLFLPGFWPHAALFIGSAQDRKRMQVKNRSNYLSYAFNDSCTLEARKDGVHYRSLSDTLSVDAFVVIRPNFNEEEIKQALSRVSVHAGKAYNFDFDFFRSDQLVCTEVVYRAYDGINDKQIPLQSRMGRKTLSAEDLLDLALDTDWAEPVAIFGVGKSKKTLIVDSAVSEVLIESYRSAAPSNLQNAVSVD